MFSRRASAAHFSPTGPKKADFEAQKGGPGEAFRELSCAEEEHGKVMFRLGQTPISEVRRGSGCTIPADFSAHVFQEGGGGGKRALGVIF